MTASRSNAATPAPHQRDTAPSCTRATCPECGRRHSPARRDAEFCSATCRQRWHSRRAQRGADLYDLYMAHRFDRQTATALGLLAIINRACSTWRAEDAERRAGRRSWRPPAAVLAAKPWLRAITIDGRRK